MDQLQLEEVRAIARQLAKRIQEEPAFAQQVLQDPFATLSSAGLTEEFIPEFLERTQLSDVQGYLSPSCGLTLIF